MKRNCVSIGLTAMTLGLLLTARAALAADDAKKAEAEIRDGAKRFVEAFDHADARAIADLWTKEGTLVDDEGQTYKGRDAIEAAYAAFFKREQGAKIDIAVQSLELPAPGVAVEDGTARVMAKTGEPPVASRYTAVHTLVDGHWRMASVRESAVNLPSTQEHLQELDFLVGKWRTESGSRVMQTSVRWIANKNFLEREYSVRDGGVVISSGKQIIGWDPAAEKIRSWCFDSSGGFGVGLWTATPDGYTIETRGLLPDGAPTTSRDFLIRVAGENDVFGFKSTMRTAGDAQLADTPEVALDRVTEPAPKKSPSER